LRRLAIAAVSSANSLDETGFVQHAVRLAIRTALPAALRATASSSDLHNTDHAQHLSRAAISCEDAQDVRAAAQHAEQIASAASIHLNEKLPASNLAKLLEMNIAAKAQSAAHFAFIAAEFAMNPNRPHTIVAAITIAEALEWSRAALQDSTASIRKPKLGRAGDALLAAYSEGLVGILVEMTPGANTWLDLTHD